MNKGAPDTDLVVIGTGGGGMGAALEAARLGKRVTIIERGTIGGCCVNVGCIPSKALIKAAHLRHEALAGRFAGLRFEESQNDWGELLRERRELVQTLRREKYERVLEGFDSITLKRVSASFAQDSDKHPIVLLDDGSRLRARKYVIATGSRNRSLGIPGEEEVKPLDSTAALFLEERPDSLVVVGGGFVAVELGQAFSRLGTKIVGIEARSRLLSAWDEELSEELRRSLESEGIPVDLQSRPVRFFRDGAQKCVEVETADGSRRILRATEILVACGRLANTNELHLSSIGIEVETETQKIPVNAYMQTQNPHVYAVGDASSLPNLVYVAARSGKMAAAHAFGEKPAPIDPENIPEVVFASPECARVGLTLKKAKEQGFGKATESRLDLEHLPKALVSNQTQGFVKLVFDPESGILLGAHVLSPRAGELIQTASLALALGKKHGFTVDEFRDMLFAYLTEAEGLKLAAQTFSMNMKRLSCCAG